MICFEEQSPWWTVFDCSVDWGFRCVGILMDFVHMYTCTNVQMVNGIVGEEKEGKINLVVFWVCSVFLLQNVLWFILSQDKGSSNCPFDVLIA